MMQLLKKIAGLFSSSQARANDIANKLALVRYMEKKGNVVDAVSTLKLLLLKYPFEPETSLALIKLYDDKLDKKSEAAKIIDNYFNRHHVEPRKYHSAMLTRYAAICGQLGHRGTAVSLLERELKRKTIPANEQQLIIDTVEGLKDAIKNSPLDDPNAIKPPVKDYSPANISNQTLMMNIPK